MRFFLFLWCFVFLSGVRGDEVSDAKRGYEVADGKLNQVYGELKRDLPEWKFKMVQEDQREWLGYRDYMMDPQHPGAVKKVSVEYWETMKEWASGRVRYLEAWKTSGDAEGWSGFYEDGRGGYLYLSEKDGVMKFKVEVVRGPTFHTGGIFGNARVNEDLGHFSDGGGEGREETWLHFELEGNSGRVVVRGANTGYYHGARAYFSGTYLRMRDLTEKEMKDIGRETRLDDPEPEEGGASFDPASL